MNAAEQRGRAEAPKQVTEVRPFTEVIPAELVRELRQTMVTMRRVGGTPSLRSRAIGDCNDLLYRADRIEELLKGAGK
jgi:hypothetical protein